jgi:hypothetical protein
MKDNQFDPDAALERRIDASLRRSFTPPERATWLPADARARVRLGPRPGIGGRERFELLAAAAGLLALGALGWLLRARAEPPQRIARVEPVTATLATAPAAPLSAPAAAAPELDFDALYNRLIASEGSASTDGNEELSSKLVQRYETCLDLVTPDCALRGPYAAPEWPSATLLLGYCLGDDPTPSLLVVDDQTMLGCASAPRPGALSPFYREVGGLAVWEISPRAEPRLLDAVRVCER